MSVGVIKNLQKLLTVQKAKVQQLECELSEIKQSKACLEDDFFHVIAQLQSNNNQKNTN